MGRLVDLTGKEEIAGPQVCRSNPGLNGLARRARHLELDGLSGLLLHDFGAGGYPLAVGHIAYPKLDKVTGPELAVYTEVEEREVANTTLELETDPDGPNFLQPERCLLAYELSLVPRLAIASRSCYCSRKRRPSWRSSRK